MHHSTILFDLDGTLTDPREGITRSIQHALAQLGIDEPDLAKLEPFIGPPLLQAVMESCFRKKLMNSYESLIMEGLLPIKQRKWKK